MDNIAPSRDPRPRASEWRRLIDAGISASRQGSSALALDCFAQASACDPHDPMAHLLAGSEHAAAGAVDEAERHLAQAVLLAPAFHVARYQLGLLQFAAGRAAPALLTWQPLLQAPDARPLAHFVRGFAALARADWAGAEDHFAAGLADEEIEGAIRQDVARVLQRMRAARADPAAPPASAEPGIGRHVLVANYGGAGGTLH